MIYVPSHPKTNKDGFVENRILVEESCKNISKKFY